MDNPSRRVNGHGGSRSRTFIVENYAEDEFGQLATNEVPGEQGYIDDEISCFWTWDDNENTWQSRLFKKSPSEEMKRQRKRKRQRWIQRKWKSIHW